MHVYLLINRRQMISLG